MVDRKLQTLYIEQISSNYFGHAITFLNVTYSLLWCNEYLFSHKKIINKFIENVFLHLFLFYWNTCSPGNSNVRELVEISYHCHSFVLCRGKLAHI